MRKNFNKEKSNITSLSKEKANYVYVDFLENLNYVQEIGLGEPSINYTTYKNAQKLDKNGNIILKKHPYFSSVNYHIADGIVKSIRLHINPKKVENINEILISLYGAFDQVSYGHFGQSIIFVPNKYYIVFKSADGRFSSADRYIDISALDFAENQTKYDEFSKVGMVYFNYTPIKRINDATFNCLYFIYSYDKKDNYKGLAIKNEYRGNDWLFIDKIDFLIDNNELLTLDVNPNRKVEKLYSISCVENSINTVSLEFIDKILNAKNVKVKISGKNSFMKFDLTPLHKYQILTAKYYYENGIIPTE